MNIDGRSARFQRLVAAMHGRVECRRWWTSHNLCYSLQLTSSTTSDLPFAQSHYTTPSEQSTPTPVWLFPCPTSQASGEEFAWRRILLDQSNYSVSSPCSPVKHKYPKSNVPNYGRGNSEGFTMAPWNSTPLEIISQVFGWSAFICWSVGGYPQVILNYLRKSVVGLNFDFVVLNLTKQSSYLIYNAVLYFSPAVQRQYREKYGVGQMIPVAANDVAFSIHAVVLVAFTLFQIAIYERGTQKVSKISIGIVSAAWLSAAVCVIIALPTHSWLWLISVFNTIQVVMTTIKYIPQAFMNFRRKSTKGFSISNILFDLSGGVANYAQMTVQSIDQGSWVNFYGNIGKLLISLVSVSFDLIFITQHYLLYPGKKVGKCPKLDDESREPLIKSVNHQASENV